MSYYYLKNEERNGLEIYFGGKPSEDILSRLKEAHWRWYPTKGCWYTKYSKEKENFAKEICNSPQPTAPESSSSENISSNESSNPQPISAPIVPPKLKCKYKVFSLCRDSSIIERNRVQEKKLGIKDLDLYYYVTGGNTFRIIGAVHAIDSLKKKIRFFCTFYDNDGDVIATESSDIWYVPITPENFFDGFPFSIEICTQVPVCRIKLVPKEES